MLVDIQSSGNSVGVTVKLGTKGEIVSIGAVTVDVMSPGCGTVADTSGRIGETVPIGVETVAVMSPGCVTAVVTITEGIGETVPIGA